MSICGEESFGTGSNHIREKDGIWAVIAWLNILALYNKENPEKDASITNIQTEFWGKYGRTFFTRYDYENLSSEAAGKIVSKLDEFANNPATKNAPFPGNKELTVVDSGDFSYTDLDGSVSTNQGLFFKLSNGARIVLRLSGTGSSGATIRLYCEKYTDNESDYKMRAEDFLKPTINTVVKFLNFQDALGTEEPTVKT